VRTLTVRSVRSGESRSRAGGVLFERDYIVRFRNVSTPDVLFHGPDDKYYHEREHNDNGSLLSFSRETLRARGKATQCSKHITDCASFVVRPWRRLSRADAFFVTLLGRRCYDLVRVDGNPITIQYAVCASGRGAARAIGQQFESVCQKEKPPTPSPPVAVTRVRSMPTHAYTSSRSGTGKVRYSFPRCGSCCTVRTHNQSEIFAP